MNKGLLDYLESKGAKTMTEENCPALAEYGRAMREEVIPAIERDLNAQRRAAHFARLGIPMAIAATLASCTTPPQSVGDHVIYRDRLVEVPRPCPVTKPVRPGKLARPLPSDPGALVSMLEAKLFEWAGKGGYGEKADAAISVCTAPQSTAPAR